MLFPFASPQNNATRASPLSPRTPVTKYRPRRGHRSLAEFHFTSTYGRTASRDFCLDGYAHVILRSILNASGPTLVVAYHDREETAFDESIQTAAAWDFSASSTCASAPFTLPLQIALPANPHTECKSLSLAVSPWCQLFSSYPCRAMPPSERRMSPAAAGLSMHETALHKQMDLPGFKDAPPTCSPRFQAPQSA